MKRLLTTCIAGLLAVSGAALWWQGQAVLPSLPEERPALQVPEEPAPQLEPVAAGHERACFYDPAKLQKVDLLD